MRHEALFQTHDEKACQLVTRFIVVTELRTSFVATCTYIAAVHVVKLNRECQCSVCTG